MEGRCKVSANSDENDDSKTLMEVQEKEKLKENEHEDDGEFFEEFTCCICLDLLYKPVVFACGHISCFWCVFIAMDSWHESHCPICRHPYNHFPSVCQLLHFLLMKLYPLSYKRRERQVGEEEKKIGHFSPQFDHHIFKLQHSKGSDAVDMRSQLHRIEMNSENHSGEGKSSSCKDTVETDLERGNGSTIKPEIPHECLKATADSYVSECSQLGNTNENENQNLVSIDDILCATCGKMLFRPIVLNCGHVYCESCMSVAEDGNCRCLVCQSLHPHGLPSICLVIDHFVEKQFPELYAERREALLKETNGSTCTPKRAGRSSSFPQNVYGSWWFGNGPKVHVGVGCDYCGVYPIIGERYKCKDCVETIGFDLCEACHNSPVKIPGRFNQQHKAEHEFVIVQPASIIGDMLSRIDADFSDDDPLAGENFDVVFHPISSRNVVVSDDDPEISEVFNTDAALTAGTQVSSGEDLDSDDPSSDLAR